MKWYWIVLIALLITWLAFRRKKTPTERELAWYNGKGWAPGITEVVLDDGSVLGDNIAAVDRGTGVMYLNQPMIRERRLNKDQVLFIMLHEMKHLELQTDNEELVDKEAHNDYLEMGGSLKQSVYALTEQLRFNKDEDIRRANAQYQRAKFFDDNRQTQ